MTKKEYIIKILNALVDDREVARPLLVLIEGNSLSDDSISSITDIFRNALDSTMNNIKKAKLEKSIGYLERIQKMEDEHNTREQSDIEDLESKIMSL